MKAHPSGSGHGSTLRRANKGFQFTINGSGFAGYARFDVQVTSSEAGAVPNPNYVVSPTAPPDPFIGAIAPLNADGSFSFAYALAEGQQLPATIGVYTSDDFGNNQTLLYSTMVSSATVCADSSNLAGAKSLLPTTGAQCKGHGYKVFVVFKTQGDCVSFLTTGGGNKAGLLP